MAPHDEHANAETPVRVTVCAATYRRPQGLRRLLDGLSALTFENPTPKISIIIVDNDPAGSAQPFVEDAAARLPWTVAYVHEPAPGIVAARNAALDAVADDAQFICFIDDDECPERRWLDELLRVQRAELADVVGGPVLPRYENGVPGWVIAGRFFERPRRATGSRIGYAATNNVLCRAQTIRQLGLRFDPAHQPMGEDRHFFRLIAHAGGRLVWADDAIVQEWIPAERATARRLIARMYHIARSTTRTEVSLHAGIFRRLLQLAKGIVWLAIGIVSLPAGVLARRWAVHALRWLAYGMGLLRGLAD